MTSPADRCRDVELELEAFHLGQLSEADAARVRAHVGECPACAAELEEVAALFRIADGIEEIEPSAGFLERVDAMIDEQAGPRSRPDRGAAAAVLALLAFAGGRFRSSRRFRVVTVAAAAHLVVLVLATFVFLPGARDAFRSPVIEFDPSLFARDVLDEQRVDPGEELAGGDMDPPELLPQRDDPVVEPDLTDPNGGIPGPRQWNRRMTPGRRFPSPQVAALMMGRIDRTRKESWVLEARGDLRTLESIRRALTRLAETQAEDGSWSSGVGYDGYREGVTGLAVLAFLADGHSTCRGDHRETVERAVAWLSARQSEDGLIASEGFDKPMYGHAIATLALIEVYGLDYELRVPRSGLRRRIRDAVGAIETAQKGDGGWRYLPRRGESDRSPGDASVTLWQLLALELAAESGFPVSRDVLSRGREFLDRRTQDADGGLTYMEGRTATTTLTAGRLVLRPVRDADRDRTERGRRLVRRSLPSGSDVRDPLLWFYATLGMRRTGDPGFKTWSAFTVRTLLESQRRDGSWAPDMLHGQQGGSAYATAMGVLVLAVDFRDRRTHP